MRAASAAASGSASKTAWSPSTPKASSTRSMSVGPSNTSPMTLACDGGVEGVEGHELDLGAPGPQLGGRRLGGLEVAHGEHDVAAAGVDQATDRGQGDLGGSAEHQDGLRGSEGVLHGVSRVGRSSVAEQSTLAPVRSRSG